MYIDKQTPIGLVVVIRLVTLITVWVNKAYPNRTASLTEPTPNIKTIRKRGLL